MNNEKLIKETIKDSDDAIDGISKLPYSKQIKNFKKSTDKLEESKEKLKNSDTL